MLQKAACKPPWKGKWGGFGRCLTWNTPSFGASASPDVKCWWLLLSGDLKASSQRWRIIAALGSSSECQNLWQSCSSWVPALWNSLQCTKYYFFSLQQVPICYSSPIPFSINLSSHSQAAYLSGGKYVSKKSRVRNEPVTYGARTAGAWAATHTENEMKMLVNSNGGCSSRERVSEPGTGFSPWGVLKEVWDLFKGLCVVPGLVCSASSLV